MSLPTDDNVRKWATEAVDHYSKKYGTQTAVWERVSEMLNPKAIDLIIAKSAGLKFDTWDREYEPGIDFEKGLLYKKVETLVAELLAKALDGYELKLSPKEIASIRACYRKAYVEQLREAAETKGVSDAKERFETVINDIVKTV
jgi:hypothetical protein